MSVKTTLLLEDKEINVLWFNYAFNQRADGTGRPSNAPVFLGIQLAIETRKDLNLAEWSFSPTQTREIELHISPIILGGRTRTLKFYDCHLLKWDNHFSSTGAAPMHEVLHISAAGVKDSNSSAEYSAYWRKTFNNDEAEPTTLETEEEGAIKEFYFEDINRNRISQIRKNQDVYLVVKTENMEGETIDVDLSDDDYNFEYEGNILPNDQLLDYAVNSSTIRIPLKTIKQK